MQRRSILLITSSVQARSRWTRRTGHPCAFLAVPDLAPLDGPAGGTPPRWRCVSCSLLLGAVAGLLFIRPVCACFSELCYAPLLVATSQTRLQNFQLAVVIGQNINNGRRDSQAAIS